MSKLITIQLYSLLSSKFFTTSILLLFCFLSYCQESTFHFKHKTFLEILDELEGHYDIDFNYNVEFADTPTKYSFSVNGQKDQVLKKIESEIGVEFLQLEGDLYLIRFNSIPDFDGQVLNQLGDPLFGVAIGVKRLNYFVESDVDGSFHIQKELLLSDKLAFHILGFEEKSIQVSEALKASPIILKQSELFLGEIVIKDNILRNIEKLGERDIETNTIINAVSPDNDGMGISQSISGIYNSTESINDIQIRGGPPDQTNITWNNIRLFQNSLFYGKVGSANPLMTNTVKMNKNGGSVSEASNSAGTIKFNSTGFDSLNIFQLHSNLLYSNVKLTTPIIDNKIQLNLAYRSTYPSALQSGIFNNFFRQSFQLGIIPDDQFYAEVFDLKELVTYNEEFKFDDFSANAIYALSKNTQLNFSYLKVENQTLYTQRGEVLNEDTDDELSLSNEGYSFDLNHRWNKHFSTNILLSHSLYDYQFLGVSRSKSSSDFDSRNQINRVDLSNFKLNNQIALKGLQFEIGIERTSWDVLFNDFSQDQDSISAYSIHEKEAYEWSGFLNSNWLIHNQLNLQAGLRISDYSLRFESRKFIEPRLSLSYLPIKNLTVNLHYGRYHQALNRRNIFTPFEVDNGFWFLADEGVTTDDWINVVWNEQLSLNFLCKFKNWSINSSLYKKDIHNLWTSSFEFTYEEDIYEFVKSEVRGLEFSIEYRNKWGILNSTFDWVDDRLVRSDASTFKSPYFQPFRMMLSYQILIDRFEVGIQWQFAKGRYYSNPSEFAKEIDANGAEYYVTKFDELLDRQGPDYHRLDINVKYKFLLNQRRQFNVGLNLLNMYNRDNVIRTFYRIDYRNDPLNYSRYENLGIPFSFNFYIDFNF